jgi:hypothetical protein
MPSVIRLNAVGNYSTARPVAFFAMLCRTISGIRPCLLTTIFTTSALESSGIMSAPWRSRRSVRAQGQLPDIDSAAISSELSVLGRFLITKKQSDIASFKTPGLRNLLVTGPYFHDGSMETLWDAMDHYNKGDGIADPWLDNDMQPLALTEPEIDDVVVFLASLTSPQYREAGDREYARQLALSKVNRPQRDNERAFGPKPQQPPPPPL